MLGGCRVVNLPPKSLLSAWRLLLYWSLAMFKLVVVNETMFSPPPSLFLPEWPIHSCPHNASSEMAYVSWVILYIWWFSVFSAEIRCFLVSITQILEIDFHALCSILCGHSVVPFSYSVSLDQLTSPLAIVHECVFSSHFSSYKIL